jgi:hypothetical protein
MPNICFSYPSDVPPGSQNRSAAQPVPVGLRRMPYSCFRYPLPCFSYPDNVLAGIRNRDAAEPTSRDPRTMPSTCFRYEADTPRQMPHACFGYSPGAKPILPGLRRMPIGTCFRY